MLVHKQYLSVKKLWRNVCTKQKFAFWEYFSYRDKIPEVKEKSLPKAKANVLKSLRYFKDLMIKADDTNEVKRIDEEITLIEREERRKPPKALAQAMTEFLFWDIIEKSSNFNVSSSEQVETIVVELEKLKAFEIKRFQKILLDKMAQAYHWDVWALAYAARGGCSDDAFEGFRAWLILQNKEIFDAALKDVNQVIHHVPQGYSTDALEFLNAAMIAYDTRSGKPFPKIRSPQPKEPQGQAWEEEDLPKRYPKLAKFYGILDVLSG
jgi:hypothetical protein